MTISSQELYEIIIECLPEVIVDEVLLHIIATIFEEILHHEHYMQVDAGILLPMVEHLPQTIEASNIQVIVWDAV